VIRITHTHKPTGERSKNVVPLLLLLLPPRHHLYSRRSIGVGGDCVGGG
jgi:hypothetical protein